MPKAAKSVKPEGRFFEVRLGCVLVGRSLPYDLYLIVSGQPVLFRKSGDALTVERFEHLRDYGNNVTLLVPDEQRSAFLDSLKTAVRDPDVKAAEKSRLIKETAYIHIHDLFTKKDIQPVIGEAKSLVEDMVSFVSTDVAAVTTLMRLSAHDYYTYNHSVDVAVYSIVIAKKIFGSDNREVLIQAGLGGLLHDIGKRKIDIKVINKSGGPTADEWAEIKNHPRYGIEYLQEFQSVPDESKKIVFEHHENYDGTGYPNGYSGEEISKLARVVAIADVFDALTTKRSYHDAISPAQALDIMHGMQPGKFDPTLFLSFDQKFLTKPAATLAADFDPCQPQKIKLVKK